MARAYRFHIERNDTALVGPTATWSNEHQAKVMIRGLRVADKTRGNAPSKYIVIPCFETACSHEAGR